MNKSLGLPENIVLLLIIFIGPFYQVLPIENSYLYRITSLTIIVLMVTSLIKDERMILYVAKIIFFSFMINLLAIIFKNFYTIFFEIILSGILGYLIYFNINNSKSVLIYFLFIVCYFIIYYIKNGDLNEALTSLMGNINKEGLSRNYIGILLLQTYLVYYSVSIRNNINPKNWPIIFIILVSALSAGISSFLMSLFLLIGFLIINMRKIYGILVIFSLIISITIFFLFYQDLYLSLEIYSRLESGDGGIDRINIITDFYEKLNLNTLFLGFDSTEQFLPSSGYEFSSTNTHNSYLNLYKEIGILSIFYIILIIYLNYRLYFINKMLGYIFTCVLVRASTDGYLFTSYIIDFIIFYLFIFVTSKINLNKIYNT